MAFYVADKSGGLPLSALTTVSTPPAAGHHTNTATTRQPRPMFPAPAWACFDTALKIRRLLHGTAGLDSLLDSHYFYVQHRQLLPWWGAFCIQPPTYTQERIRRPFSEQKVCQKHWGRPLAGRLICEFAALPLPWDKRSKAKTRWTYRWMLTFVAF